MMVMMVMIQHTLHYLAFKRAQQRPPRERDNPGSILDWVMYIVVDVLRKPFVYLPRSDES